MYSTKSFRPKNGFGFAVNDKTPFLSEKEKFQDRRGTLLGGRGVGKGVGENQRGTQMW